jgi:hypothetical protein
MATRYQFPVPPLRATEFIREARNSHDAVWQAYKALCEMPHGQSRLNLQGAMAALRDELARLHGRDPNEVQDWFALLFPPK